MVRHTFKILHQMLQDFLSVSDHFWTLCIKALIFGSESIPEATKYVSEIGKERDGDGKEKVTDSIDRAQSTTKRSILEVCIYFKVESQLWIF